ncbi:hypothetical protein BC826DRAFT_986265 [Russula brevipes]|nr:hypothetical protein BC826DRAFT_986265 [Russula brevipes]
MKVTLGTSGPCPCPGPVVVEVEVDGVALDPCCGCLPPMVVETKVDNEEACCCCWLVVGEGEACDDGCCCPCPLDEVVLLCVPATTPPTMPPTMKMMRAITPMPHRVRYHGTFLTRGSWLLGASSRTLPAAPGLWLSVAGWFESDGASFGGVGSRRYWHSSSRPTSYSPYRIGPRGWMGREKGGKHAQILFRKRREGKRRKSG